MNERNSHIPSAQLSGNPQDANGAAQILGAPLSTEEAMQLIRRSGRGTRKRFFALSQEHRELFLSFLQGTYLKNQEHKLEILYDCISQHILDPRTHPDRLESFLSALLGQQVRIRKALPRKGIRLSEKSSILIMDFLVELADCSLINVEVQRIGYDFSGERSCCYLADALMRQYYKVRSERGRDFSFQDMRPVHLIVLMKNSPKAFRDVAPAFLHQEQHSFTSGVNVKNLFHTTYISLDTFRTLIHNKDIKTPLDAWLTFFGSNDPSDVTKLVYQYPEFLPLYREITEFRTNPKELINMYSDVLSLMDRNTAVLTLENRLKEANRRAQQERIRNEQVIQRKDQTIQRKDQTIQKKIQEIAKTAAERDRLQENNKNLSAENERMRQLLRELGQTVPDAAE